MIGAAAALRAGHTRAHACTEAVEVSMQALCSHMGHLSFGQPQLLSSGVKFTPSLFKLAPDVHLGCKVKQHLDTWTPARPATPGLDCGNVVVQQQAGVERVCNHIPQGLVINSG